MKKLILMRHAKSDWSEAGQKDKERALNKRGRLAAVLMGAWLRDMGHVPQTALVSSATRTRETWNLMSFDCTTEFSDALYLAEAETYLTALHNAGDAECAIVLGHNPGMESAMGQMAGSKRISAPTAATAVYSLPIKHWRDAAFEVGSLIAFETPKSLV